MEESTVTPSPASPTEEDDPCEIDVSSMAIYSVTLLICLCGLAGNGAVICLLRLKCCNSRIFHLAVIDFLLLLFIVPSTLLFLLEDVSCSTIMPWAYLGFLFWVSVFSYYWVLWWLTAIDMLMGTYKPHLLCCHLPERLLGVMILVQFLAFIARIAVITLLALPCPSEQEEQCRVALISMSTITLLLLAVPSVIFTSINFINAKCDSQQKQLKNRDIVIFLTVLFTFLLTLWNFLEQLGYIVVSSQVFFLFNSINSTSKPFIYFLVGRYWRNFSLQRVCEEQEDNSANEDTTRDSVL